MHLKQPKRKQGLPFPFLWLEYLIRHIAMKRDYNNTTKLI